jgi:hypothetical protein
MFGEIYNSALEYDMNPGDNNTHPGTYFIY